MIRTRFNIKGETLAETIIALSVLAISVTIASTVIINSIRNLTNAKNRIIAVNLAREGVEAVRSIRDTNWLFYSDRRRQCWNHDPGSLTSCTDSPSPIVPGTYIVYKHAPEGSWYLQLADSDTSADGPDKDDIIPDNDLDLVALSLADLDQTIDSDGRDPNEDLNGANDDTDFYNHMDETAGVDSPLGLLVKTTIFTRHVTIEYLANDPANSAPSKVFPPEDSINNRSEWLDASTPKDELNRMRVTSVVGWTVGGAAHNSTLQTILTDHLGREDLSN